MVSVSLCENLRILKNDSLSIEENCPPIIPIIAELGKFGKRTVVWYNGSCSQVLVQEVG